MFSRIFCMVDLSRGEVKEATANIKLGVTDGEDNIETYNEIIKYLGEEETNCYTLSVRKYEKKRLKIIELWQSIKVAAHSMITNKSKIMAAFIGTDRSLSAQ